MSRDGPLSRHIGFSLMADSESSPGGRVAFSRVTATIAPSQVRLRNSTQPLCSWLRRSSARLPVAGSFFSAART